MLKAWQALPTIKDNRNKHTDLDINYTRVCHLNQTIVTQMKWKKDLMTDKPILISFIPTD